MTENKYKTLGDINLLKNLNHDTTNDDFNTFYTTYQFDNIIPFLTERKFCYYNPNDRQSYDDHSTNNSNYPYFNVGKTDCKTEGIPNNKTEGIANNCMQIRKKYGTIKEPDDVIKDNLINNFSYNFSIYINNIISNLFLYFSGQNNNTNYNKLSDYYDDDRKDDYKRLKYLTNKKNIYFKKYTEVYFELNKYKFNINLLINSLLIVCVIFIINGVRTEYKLFINLVLICILILYVVLGINNVKDRDFSNWDKKYFSNSSYKIKVPDSEIKID